MRTDRKTTMGVLEAVGQNLLRHWVNGIYYGRVKIAGRRSVESLKLNGVGITDKIIAKARLREWLEEKENRLWRVADTSIARVFQKTFPRPMATLVSRVRTADLAEWMGMHGKRLRHSSYNRYRLFLSDLFKVAVMAGAILKKQNP